MIRQVRSSLIHSLHHVILRGNFKQDIFMDDDDRELFYKQLSRVVGQYDCEIYVFCLMSNHIHIVVKTGYIPLSKVMQSISSNFARMINKKYGRHGHVFEARYINLPIFDNQYLVNLCYYIHMNPVKSGIVENIDDYIWSSHKAYLGKEIIPWLTTSYLEKVLKKYLGESDDAYEEFLLDKKRSLQDADYCGVSEIVSGVVMDSVKINVKLMSVNAICNLSLDTIIDVICNHMNIPKQELSLRRKDRDLSLARSLIAYFAHYHANYYLRDIAMVFNRKVESVSRGLTRMLKKSEQDDYTKRMLSVLERELVKSKS